MRILEAESSSMNPKEVLQFTDTLVFTKLGVHLNDLQRLIIESTCSGSRQGYEQIAKTHGYSPNYLKQDVGPKLWQLLSSVFGEKVKKNTFKSAIERQLGIVNRFSSSSPDPANTNIREQQETSKQTNFASSLNQDTLTLDVHKNLVNNYCHDWGEAPDVSVFYGRNKEQNTLEEWINTYNSRIIGIVGMGGIGKTHLSVKLAKRMQNQFDFLIWRSLQNEPSLEDILNSLLQSIRKKERVELPESVDGKISLLLEFLRKHRCLLILDNIETILCNGENTGCYKPGFEDYGNFFKLLGECHHTSHLIITGREKPKELALMEGENSSVQCIHLSGLSTSAGQKLLQFKGCYSSGEDGYEYLVEQYSGNPLALKIAAVAIKELFQGDIKEFIQYKTLLLDEICNLLGQHFYRISSLAKSILYWLAIHREPVSIAQLLLEIYPSVPRQKVMETLKYLVQSSLVENRGNKFTLKQIVMEYVINSLIDRVCEEVVTGELDLLKTHVLLKIEIHCSTKKAHINLITKTVIEKLITIFKNQSDLGKNLKNLHLEIEKYYEDKCGYLYENIFNLICHIPNNLIGSSLYNYKFLNDKEAS
ncbi:NB-ARC domain-containing protein [Mastigocoleus testarum]|uniref:Uncharacterized protein n=1 Tax=Mastigocoleus testarum BC008 TaxID=371196 RepID=A0A0V7ZEG6_9CYAN|nr:NB-ARC domain-containing protein [Mastigocoleus testarum]KST62930.1 hypothetical protein BC008_11465 [Mastigocoleus testarum BC008]KST63021.1 hypothetical protein BC008_11940 [Mastigocoleus testarum BC008]